MQRFPRLFPPQYVECTSEAEKNQNLLQTLSRANLKFMDILCIGGTGSGKSSTINAIAGFFCAESHPSVDPVTDRCYVYDIKNGFRFWDIPGVGDDPIKDQNTIKGISDILKCTCTQIRTLGIIDIVLLVIDINSRDLGTVFHLLSDPILKSFLYSGRMIIGLNQMDLLYQDSSSCKEKCESFRRRLSVSPAISLVPYSAKTGENRSRLIQAIISAFPGRRIISDSGIYY